MAKRVLTKDDLWCSVLGGAALSTGGGGAAPSYEAFCEAVNPVFNSGLKPTLIDPMDLSDDDPVLIPIGIGGGITRQDRERYGPPIRRGPNLDIAFKEMNRTFPVLPELEGPVEAWREAGIKRLTQIKGEEEYVAYLAGEIGPNIYRLAINGARDRIPVVDADMTGLRAVPELSFSTFNAKGLPAMPLVITTIWGDMLVYERAISWQRIEDITRAIARVSMGFNSTMMSADGKMVKEATVHGTYSKTIDVGRAIQEARESGDDPVNKIVEVTDGYRIFEGEFLARTTEGRFAFTWGNGWIKGTGDYEGKLFRFWFKNENMISWIDGKPYVTCPDPFTVVDSETGDGLSNFRADMWTPGRRVSVVGVRAVDLWRTERGLRIFNPGHFGFDIEYRPIEEVVGK